MGSAHGSGKKTVSEATVPMPAVLLRLAERMRCLPVLAKFHPNEANAIDTILRVATCLKPHVDDRSAHQTGQALRLYLMSIACHATVGH